MWTGNFPLPCHPSPTYPLSRSRARPRIASVGRSEATGDGWGAGLSPLPRWPCLAGRAPLAVPRWPCRAGRAGLNKKSPKVFLRSADKHFIGGNSPSDSSLGVL